PGRRHGQHVRRRLLLHVGHTPLLMIGVMFSAGSIVCEKERGCPGSLAHLPSSRRGAVVVVQSAEHGNRDDRAGERGWCPFTGYRKGAYPARAATRPMAQLSNADEPRASSSPSRAEWRLVNGAEAH